MQKIFFLMTVLGICMSCADKNATVNNCREMEEKDTVKREQYEGFYKASADEISDDLFVIHKDWMLVTAGNDTSFNTMTASWGGFGTLWNKSVNVMFIRKSRYTFEFLEREGKYTLSFYDTTKYRETMLMLGTKSGRDSEKIKESGLTPLKMPHGSMAFAEADMIIECAILQHQQFDPATIRSEEVLKMFPFYLDKKDPDCHYIFFGEILNVWKKDKK